MIWEYSKEGECVVLSINEENSLYFFLSKDIKKDETFDFISQRLSFYIKKEEIILFLLNSLKQKAVSDKDISNFLYNRD